MRFSCNQQILNKALNTVSKAVSNKTTMPILKGILIEANENGKLLLTASDSDISIKKEIDAKVDVPGSIVVTAKLFGDIVRKLPNEDIYIDDNEGNSSSIDIKTSNSEFKVICLPRDEFPKIEGLEEYGDYILFEKNTFKDMVRKTVFAASIEESKGILTGILTEIGLDSVRMVSLDGFRLALVNEMMQSSEERRVIIAAKIMNEISKIISDEDDDAALRIYISDKNAAFEIGTTVIMLRLMEGEFIRYRDIIPENATTKIIINKSMVLESIERASLLAKEGKNNLIKMTIKDDLLTITSRSEEGNVKEEIPIEKTGNDIEIGFNSKYVIDVLKVIDDETFSMNLNTGISPCVVRPAEGNEYEYLILPVRIPSM